MKSQRKCEKQNKETQSTIKQQIKSLSLFLSDMPLFLVQAHVLRLLSCIPCGTEMQFLYKTSHFSVLSSKSGRVNPRAIDPAYTTGGQ